MGPAKERGSKEKYTRLSDQVSDCFLGPSFAEERGRDREPSGGSGGEGLGWTGSSIVVGPIVLLLFGRQKSTLPEEKPRRDFQVIPTGEEISHRSPI